MSGALGRLTAIVGRTFARGRNALPATRPVRLPFSVRAPPPAHRPVADPVHLDAENFNMHSAMANDPTYDETIVRLDAKQCWPVVTDRQFRELVAQDFGARTAAEVCDDFLRISVYATGREFCLLDAMFDGLRNRLIAVLPTVADHELMSVFRLIPLWNVKNAKDPVFFKLWSEFDKQCIERYKTWSLNKLLLCMDHWYIMRLSRLSNFVWLGVRKMARKPSRLTPKQLVQMMFYANTSRKYLPSLPMYDIEQEICSYYNDFNIKELGIVSLGFFKTQTPIRNQELVRNMHISVINEIENIRSFEMAAFLKIFRYCTKYQNAEFMYKLMDALTEKVYDVQLMCCTQMAILGTNLLIKHEGLLKKISQRIVDEISQTRIKDLERLTLALTMLNYNPKTTPCIFETIINELRSDTRLNEFEKYPRSYIFTLSYLAVNNIFPYDCISKALTNFQKIYGKKLSRFTVPRDILCLNNSLHIECNDYTGTLLPETLRISCNEHYAWHTPNSSTLAKESATDRNFMKMYRELLRVFQNESYFHTCYPLPHHPKCDILFCIDSDCQPVIIPETMKNKTVFNDFQKPPKLGKWFAIMILSRNSVLYSSKEYTGLTLCKIRQLKKLDYDPIVITFEELNNCDNIQHLIFNKFKTHGVVIKYK